MEKLTIYILSEDSNKNSFNIIVNIVEQSLKAIEEELDIQYLDFNPQYNNKHCINANRWKNCSRLDVIQFMQELISDLIKENTFVFWHVDADKKWSKIENSENVNDLKELKIKLFKTSETLRNSKTLDVSKIFSFVPCYSIESWLYPFVDKIRLKRNHTFQFSGVNINTFDEISQIKDKSGIGDKYNLKLSEKFEHKTLYNIKKSYVKSFDEVEVHQEFTDAIKERVFQY